MIRFVAVTGHTSDFKPKGRPMHMTHKQLMAYALYAVSVLALGAYFAMAAVQGENGIFHRAEVEAELHKLQTQLSALQDERDEMLNLTRRLSDGFLDLDLLDQQARDVLGLLRANEVLVN